MYTHKCIKPDCTQTYEDQDPDAYYCKTCNEARKIVAKEIDKKISTISKRPHMSGIQEYDATPKVHGFLHVRL